MKEEPNQNYTQDMDFLLFEYLEGDLNEERSLDLKERLAFDETLQEEVKFWKESHVEQGFYNTEELERKLQLKVPYENKNSTAFYMIGIILLTSFLSLIPIKVEEGNLINNQPTSFKEKSEIDKKSISSLNPVEHLGDTRINSTTELLISVKVKQLSILEEKRSQERISKIPPFDFEDLLVGSDFKKRDDQVKPIDIVSQPKQDKPGNKTEKTHETYNISRKHQREIERAKEKALQRSRELKFLRGNKPYVVPLSPNF